MNTTGNPQSARKVLPRRIFHRNRRAVALVCGVALVTACSSTPDRSDEAARIAVDLEAKPGVRAIEYRYAHGASEGNGLYLTVSMSEKASGGNVLGVSDELFTRFATGGFDGHALS